MASLNPLTRELVFKVVFYGPGLGGKTTTLQHIHGATKPENRGNLVSLATPTDRTLYFDFLPIRVPRIRDMNVRLQLFTVPGQVYFGATRKLVLTGADGIVFVADSQHERQDANQESLEDLNANLAEHARSLSHMPHIFQWNKRDLPEILPTAELDRRFNLFGVTALETIASRGDGVFESLEQITKAVINAYRAEMPKGGRELATFLEASDEGLTDAIRGLTESPSAAANDESIVDDAPPTRSLGSNPSAALQFASRRDPTPPPPAKATPEALPEEKKLADVLRVHPKVAIVHVDGGRTQAGPTAAPPSSLFSFAELWPEGERDGIRRAEALLGAGDATGAVLACDLLLARILASAGSVAGSLEAPRDPGLVCLLLGLEGRRYLQFRAVIRAARQSEEITRRSATDCLLFVLEARRAKDEI